MRVRLAADVPGVVPSAQDHGARRIVVLVEPLYVGSAAALALDAGWSAVELAAVGDDAPAPIPLVSFEQPPPREHRAGGMCRVRCDARGIARALGDLAVDVEHDVVVLGSICIARPLASRIARERPTSVVLVPMHHAGAVAADAWWACGVLARLLVEEIDGVMVQLDEAAGITVALVGDVASQARSELGAGVRWDAHIAAGGSADDLRVAASVDSCGVIPRFVSIEPLRLAQW